MSAFTVIGAGSIGLLFAAGLSAAKIPVELVVRREEQKRALELEGITIKKLGMPDVRVYPKVRLMTEPSMELEATGNDRESSHVILLAVKQTAIHKEFAEELQRQMGSNSIVLCVQNGIGHAEVLSAYIPKEKLLLGVTTEAALRQSDTSVEHTGQGETWIGPWKADMHQPFLAEKQKIIAKELETAGFRTYVSNEMLSRIWQKLLINAAINPLTAILDIRNGELLRLKHAHSLMLSILDEGLTLAAALQIDLPPNLEERLEEVCRLTANNHSSMLQDLLAGRKTEIEAITGSLIRLSEEHGVSMPVNRSIYQLVKAMEELGLSGG